MEAREWKQAIYLAIVFGEMLFGFIECFSINGRRTFLFLFTIRLPSPQGKCIVYIGYIYNKTFAIWKQKIF